ncbi:hypothetical protein GCM10023212_32400 [Luteolibacter yonseiensis]
MDHEMKVSGEKYKVSIRGRAGIAYTESGLVVHIDSEMLHSPEFDMVVCLENHEAWGAEGPAVPDADKMAVIKERVRHELRKLKVEWQ